MSEEKIVFVDPNTLKPDPNNPRSEIDPKFIDELADSYKRLGVIEPVEVDESGMIRRGHQRVLACSKAGVKVPIRRKAGLTPEQWYERQMADDALRKSLSQLDSMWAYATGVVNINSEKEGKFYTIKQVKAMYEKDRETLLNLIASEDRYKHVKMGQAELARRIFGDEKYQSKIHYYLQPLLIEGEKLSREAVKALETKREDFSLAKLQATGKVEDPEAKKILQEQVVRGEFKAKRDTIRDIASAINKEEVPKEVKMAVAKDPELISGIPYMTEAVQTGRQPPVPMELPKHVQEKISAAVKEITAKQKQVVTNALEKTDVQVRWYYRPNQEAHDGIIMDSNKLFCPICGSDHSHLKWVCEGHKPLPVQEAQKIINTAIDEGKAPNDVMQKKAKEYAKKRTGGA